MTECASESGSVSKMMQDRHVCAAHHEQKLSCGLSIRVVSIDLNDLECHSPVAGLLKYNLANILCNILHGFNCHSGVVRSLGNS